MRLCHRAGHAVPLLTLFTLFAGCATSTVPQPENFTSNPQVVAIYAVDSAFGTLPDVLVFSSSAADAGKVSAEPPPSYGSYRVEFDQPVNGPTVANNANRSTGPNPGGAASFCSPLLNTPVQLLDVQGDADRPAGPVVSSICYDATSPLGSHPHIIIVPGRDALTNAAATPLTCNTFRASGPARGPGGNIFKPTHKYGIQVKADIQNAAGKPLAAPQGAGWVNDTFVFTTSGLKIMAAGFVDATTGFFVWQEKPEPGFEKDLAPCAGTATCPDASGNNNQGTFQKPADGSPFIVVLTEPVSDASAVTLVRTENQSDPESSIGTGGGLLGDPRVIEVNTGDTFEPGVSYQVTVPPGLVADTGTETLAAGATYTFSAQPGSPDNLSTTPVNGAQAQNHANTTSAVTHTDPDTDATVPNDPVPVTASTRPQVEFSSPVAADAAGSPVGTFTLKDAAGTVVPTTAAFRTGFNHQLIRLTPSVALVPETAYTLSWSGVKPAAVPQVFSTATFPDGQAQFTTATFRMAIIHDPAQDTATSNTNIANTGVAIPGATVVTVNLDRRTDVRPASLKGLNGGGLIASFDNTPSGVNASTLTISEVTGTTTTPIPGFTVAPAATGSPTEFTITLPASYQLKYGQKYEVRAATTITNPTTGKALKAEGCTTGDCSDVKSFTTRKVSVSVAANPSTTAPTGFKVTFSDPMDPATINPSQFNLFPRDASGALGTQSVPLSCVITDGPGSAPPGDPANNTVVTCTAQASLGNAPQSFLASAVFLQTAPARVTPTISTDPSAQFTGNGSANIFSACQ